MKERSSAIATKKGRERFLVQAAAWRKELDVQADGDVPWRSFVNARVEDRKDISKKVSDFQNEKRRERLVELEHFKRIREELTKQKEEERGKTT